MTRPKPEEGVCEWKDDGGGEGPHTLLHPCSLGVIDGRDAGGDNHGGGGSGGFFSSPVFFESAKVAFCVVIYARNLVGQYIH